MYLWLWAFTPLESGDARVTRRVPVSVIHLSFATACGVVALPFVSDAARFGYSSPIIVVFLLVGTLAAVAGGLWSALVDRTDPIRGARQDRVARTVATIMLVGAAVAALVAGPPALFLTLIPLLGIALIWSSTGILWFRELQLARIDGVCEEQRAAMAEHLHDSVLQTLALIQNRRR